MLTAIGTVAFFSNQLCLPPPFLPEKPAAAIDGNGIISATGE